MTLTYVGANGQAVVVTPATPLPVTGGSGNPAGDGAVSAGPTTAVAMTTGAAVALAANALRYGGSISNPNAGVLYLLTAASGTPSAALHQVAVPSGGYYEVPFGYTGAIRGALSAGAGDIMVTEFT